MDVLLGYIGNKKGPDHCQWSGPRSSGEKESASSPAPAPCTPNARSTPQWRNTCKFGNTSRAGSAPVDLVLSWGEQKAPGLKKARRATSGALALWFGPGAPAGASGLKSTADGLHYTVRSRLSSDGSRIRKRRLLQPHRRGNSSGVNAIAYSSQSASNSYGQQRLV
jgi:hypothetical protein